MIVEDIPQTFISQPSLPIIPGSTVHNKHKKDEAQKSEKKYQDSKREISKSLKDNIVSKSEGVHEEYSRQSGNSVLLSVNTAWDSALKKVLSIGTNNYPQ